MSAIHPLTFLTWFLWGFFMGIGWLTAQGLWAGAKALMVGANNYFKWPHLDMALPAVVLPAPRKGPRWEVMGLDFDPGLGVPERTALMNDYGAGGWELVSANDNRAWFKRAVA
jgi:hypothetical protein